jgi:hypothetical protein
MEEAAGYQITGVVFPRFSIEDCQTDTFRQRPGPMNLCED